MGSSLCKKVFPGSTEGWRILLPGALLIIRSQPALPLPFFIPGPGPDYFPPFPPRPPRTEPLCPPPASQIPPAPQDRCWGAPAPHKPPSATRLGRDNQRNANDSSTVVITSRRHATLCFNPHNEAGQRSPGRGGTRRGSTSPVPLAALVPQFPQAPRLACPPGLAQEGKIPPLG